MSSRLHAGGPDSCKLHAMLRYKIKKVVIRSIVIKYSVGNHVRKQKKCDSNL